MKTSLLFHVPEIHTQLCIIIGVLHGEEIKKCKLWACIPYKLHKLESGLFI